MKNPYEVLGLSPGADLDEVKRAYKNLAAKYHPDNYSDGPLSAQAARKMEEINQAYDEIIMNSGDKSYGRYENNHRTNGYTGYTGSGFYDIREKLNQGRIDDAEMLLDGIPMSGRNAEWYFLKGSVQQRRGWFEEANQNFARAYNMEPSNQEYRSAYNNMNNSSSGGYRAERRHSAYGDYSGRGGCDFCDVCSSLICADCCCECMGGDLIPCC